MKPYLKLMRIHHYIKNFLVFAALACSGQLFDARKLLSAVIGFFAFCMISSVVYIINDIQDREKDRLHPTKRSRPIASGAVPVRNAWILAAVLTAAAAGLHLLTHAPRAGLLLLLYLVLNLGYSFGLKNIPLVDVTILVSGFLIRVLYGSMITGIVISSWLYLTVISMAFAFSFGKRRNELQQLKDCGTRRVLQKYPVAFLDKSMYMCLTLTNVFYALWSMDAATITFYQTRYLIFTCPLVLLITMKYSLDVEGDSDGDPVEVLLHDRALLALCLLYAFLMFWILYL